MVLAQGREIMLAADALRNALAAQARSWEPRTVDAVRLAQEQAFVELNRYADELSAASSDVQAPRRIEIAAQTVQSASPADRRLIAVAQDLSRQVAGLPEWRIEEPGTAPLSQAMPI
jgi:multidrug resistance protein MdtO